ncbi:MAG: mevalonate kinase [Candidatus Diapherotrites archaeon]|nr:mevalonate kinase [Candidatus Diapherotrites archaeon]
MLFGEHFVVYGLPGVAAGLGLLVKAMIGKGNGVVFDDKVFNETVDCAKQPGHVKCQMFKPVFEKLGVNDIKIRIEATMLPGVGMGYSAALSVAVIRALSKFYKLSLNDEQVNELAYKVEKVSHGTPSGIDNSCATFGGIIWFEKNMQGGKNKIEKMRLGRPLPLVIASTGKMGNTKELVAAVRVRKEKNEEEFAKIFSEYKALVPKAKDALERGDLKGIGELMKQDQLLLEKIGVSTQELESMCSLCMEKGALGAKLTGAGGGGCMIALCEDKQTQGKVFQALQEKGYRTFKTMIGA